MITGALVSYLKANLSLTSVYVNRAPLNSQPCLVIDDNGDFRERHWSATGTTTDMIEHEYEVTIWTDNTNGGAKYAEQVAAEIVTLLDNFSGPMTDTDSSPNQNYRVVHIDAKNGGGGFDAGPELYGYSVFLTLTHE